MNLQHVIIILYIFSIFINTISKYLNFLTFRYKNHKKTLKFKLIFKKKFILNYIIKKYNILEYKI